MKKSIVLGFLILFVLSTSAFAVLTDPKKETEKPAVSNPKENKLSDEELSRMNGPLKGINNLEQPTLSNINKDDLRKSPNATQDVIITNRHHGGYFWYGGAGLLLVVILIIVLI